MNMRVVISVLVIVAVSLAATLWIGGASAPSNPSQQKRFAEGSTLEIDREPPFPVATVDSAEYFFGDMEVGKSGEHTFVISNTGEDVLRLEKGASTCKCTLSNLDRPELAPGESVDIKLEWLPKAASEQFAQTATIYTNDPENSVIDLTIMGRVMNSVDIYPEDEVNAGTLVEGVGATARTYFLSKLHEKLEPPTIKYEGDRLTFQVTPMSPPDLSEHSAKAGYLIEAHVAPEIPVGQFRDQFNLEYTIDGETISLLKSVAARRTGPIRFLNAPGTNFIHDIQLLRMGRFSSKDGTQARLTLLIDHPESGGTVEITGTESERIPGLTITAHENDELDIPNRAAFDLMIEMPPGAPAVDISRSRNNYILVRTNHPLVTEVTIYVELQSF
jgi:hypothetical protein